MAGASSIHGNENNNGIWRRSAWQSAAHAKSVMAHQQCVSAQAMAINDVK